MPHFGKNLKRILKARGIKQEDFAITAGVSPDSVNRWCKMPAWGGQAEKLKVIAGALKMTPEELTQGEISESDLLHADVVREFVSFCLTRGLDPTRSASAALLEFMVLPLQQRESAIVKAGEFLLEREGRTYAKSNPQITKVPIKSGKAE
jgi:transcriptional regulator with XRE-family HTH domain